MKSPLVLLALALVLAAPAVAIAGPGDPRLVNGVLEWPRSVTTEPFLVVRGDDGALYYVGIAAVRRDVPLAAGARVSVLGLEGRTVNEITALGVGTGDTTEAALAHLQGARPAPAATPAPAVVAPAPSVVPTAPGAAAPAAVTPPSPVAAPVPVGAPPSPAAPPTPAAAPSSPAAPAPVVTPTTTSAPAVTPPTASVTPAAPAPSVAAVATTPPAPRRPDVSVTPAALPTPAGEPRRWTEISGVVESLVGRTLVLRSDEGRVAVDVSSLSQSLDRMVTPGSTVRVYGVPVEVRFKAMGVFDPGSRP